MDTLELTSQVQNVKVCGQSVPMLNMQMCMIAAGGDRFCQTSPSTGFNGTPVSGPYIDGAAHILGKSLFSPQRSMCPGTMPSVRQ